MNPSFTLTDRKGQPHHYEVQLHEPLEGLAIAQKLLALGLDPLSELAEKFLPPLLGALEQAARQRAEGGGETGELGLLDLDLDLSSLFEELPLGSAGAKLSVAFARLPPQLAQQILSGTNRDNQPLAPPNGQAVSLAFNTAYQGNYGEMYKALWRVTQLNGFLALPDITPYAESFRQIGEKILSSAGAVRSSGTSPKGA